MQAALRVALLLVATVGPPWVVADGNVGCLFSETLCDKDDEWCYDDQAFGRCVRNVGVEEEDLYRYDLSRDELHVFSRELRRLFTLGYRWSHVYTQCQLQALLYSVKNGLSLETDTCTHLADQDLEAALRVLESQDEITPEAVAIVKYTPSADNPHADYADEVYYPPERDSNDIQAVRDIILPSNAVDVLEMEDPYQREQHYAYPEVIKRSWAPPMRRRAAPAFSYNYNTPLGFRRGEESRDLVEIPPEMMSELGMERGDVGIERGQPPLQALPPYMIEEVLAEEESSAKQAQAAAAAQAVAAAEELDFRLAEENLYPFVEFLNSLRLSPYDVEYLLRPENAEELRALVEQFAEREVAERDSQIDSISLKDLINELIRESKLGNGYGVDLVRESPARFTVGYNTPDRFRAGWELRDAVPPPPISGVTGPAEDEDYQESRVYFDENDPDAYAMMGEHEYGSGHHHSGPPLSPEKEIFRELKNNPEYFQEQQQHESFSHGSNRVTSGGSNNIPNANPMTSNSNAGIYTEGGVVHVPESQLSTALNGEEEEEEESLKQDLSQLLEKYNVMGFKRPERLDVKKPGPQFATTDSPSSHVTQETGNDILLRSIIPSMMKKEPRGAAGHPDRLHDLYDDVDTDAVYVGFKNGIRTWKQGNDIVRNISVMLHLEPKTLTHVRVDSNEVTFRVGPNSQGMNASRVARKIELIKDRLKDVMGVEVISAGIGDKIKMPTVLSVEDKRGEERMYLTIMLVCSVLGAFVLAVAAILLIRRHIASRQKLHGLSRPDTEASKDYQELCRARMAAKNQPTTASEHGRITSLSRESEQSPSSRSSTSSWSEEPALHNMDISTGHMVLSYMEDHLKNKDRLDQEWVALCAYEAEPCSNSVSYRKENVDKNRYKDILPFDHARVVLNNLSNISGGDYINASSITDHDPRNPAYIAAQGPLPNTAPDFWQLIWEQGAVVIVMLTRLTEGGNAMCHRYWPEEGSELYHVYEVHLVSEHIWCDDYLVRSFYLKNARTGETRTVTQFHFLSWPEGGVPASTKALLEFRRKVNKSYRGRSCPIVVHCSDGVGRTGTYCLIDMVLSRMAKGAKEIDIAATLEHLRDQRPRMVTSKQQFEFVLTAVAEEVHAILKALPPQPAQPQHPEKP